MEELHHKVHDGSVQYARKYEGDSPAILVLPDFGESLKDDFWIMLRSYLPKNVTYFVELRGHPLSSGEYSLKHHWEDIQYWVMRLQREHGNVVVVAKGLTASMLLHYESQAHLLVDRPPLPEGMVLLSPWFQGKRVVWNHCRKPREHKAESKRLYNFVLSPVRVQTPTRIFIPHEDFTVNHLKKIFGKCLTRKVRWLHPGHRPTKVELKQGLKEVGEAIASVLEEERPIRFSTKL